MYLYLYLNTHLSLSIHACVYMFINTCKCTYYICVQFMWIHVNSRHICSVINVNDFLSNLFISEAQPRWRPHGPNREKVIVAFVTFSAQILTPGKGEKESAASTNLKPCKHIVEMYSFAKGFWQNELLSLFFGLTLWSNFLVILVHGAAALPSLLCTIHLLHMLSHASTRVPPLVSFYSKE